MKPWLDIDLRADLARFELALDGQCVARVTGIFGPSGSGKTTLLESVAGLRRDVRGSLRCGEQTWLDSGRGVFLPPQKRGVGYVPQDHRLFPHWRVRANLLAGARRAQARDSAAAAHTFDQVVATLELGPLLDRDTRSLSGGERQRVALGRALCSGPDLLLLDEPLASLDAGLRRRILPFLLRVRETFDTPMLIVSHQPAELQALCEEVWAISEGRVQARGRPVDVFTQTSVYAAASADHGFTNLLPCVAVAQEEDRCRARPVGTGKGVELSLMPNGHAPGEMFMAGIAAHEILVATAPVHGLSARNQLEATLRELRALPDKVIALAVLPGRESQPLAVELTAAAVRDLGLAPGQRVRLLVKSSSISAS